MEALTMPSGIGVGIFLEGFRKPGVLGPKGSVRHQQFGGKVEHMWYSSSHFSTKIIHKESGAWEYADTPYDLTNQQWDTLKKMCNELLHGVRAATSREDTLAPRRQMLQACMIERLRQKKAERLDQQFLKLENSRENESQKLRTDAIACFRGLVLLFSTDIEACKFSRGFIKSMLRPNLETWTTLKLDLDLREQYRHLLELFQEDISPVKQKPFASRRLVEWVLGGTVASPTKDEPPCSDSRLVHYIVSNADRTGAGDDDGDEWSWSHVNDSFITSYNVLFGGLKDSMEEDVTSFLNELDRHIDRCAQIWLDKGPGLEYVGKKQHLETAEARTVLEKYTVQRKTPLKGVNAPGRKAEYFVSGEAGGMSLEAVADSGADECYVSHSLAATLGLSPEHGTKRQIQLANKKSLDSPGSVDIPWIFSGENLSSMLKCWIVPGSVHDLILGNSFLKRSHTLTSFMHRIKKRVVASLRTPRVMLLGSQGQRLCGSLNGRQVAALPDTGCDVMLVSTAAAAKFGLKVDRALEKQIEVEFGDGSRSRSIGVVENATWAVGEHRVLSDFYVLEDLSVDVILNNDYLFEHEAFVTFDKFFFESDSSEETLYFQNIRLIGKFGDSLDLLEGDWREDINSPDAFSPEKIQKEVARRDLIRDQILELPIDQRRSATEAETERQRLWEQFRRAHQQRPQNVSSPPAGPSSTAEARKPRVFLRNALKSLLGMKRSHTA